MSQTPSNRSYVPPATPDKSVYSYRLWVNHERTILVRTLQNGNLEIATRETPDHTWGPPITLTEEKT